MAFPLPTIEQGPDLVIEARGLTCHYGRVEAVRNLDLAVRRGELFGLVGPDGAGKTTTIKMLTGILPPTAGEARVLGLDLKSEIRSIQGRVGYMSEGFSLYGTLSVGENLLFFADLYGLSKAERDRRIERLMAFSRLGPFWNREARALSGGMKKKLALCTTLLYEPELLFLDEPTTGVDPVSRRDFWGILDEFLGQGITIVVSTPYMDEAERCDRVGLIHRGRLVAAGSTRTLKEELGLDLVEILAAPQNGAREVLRHHPSVREVEIYGNWLHVLTSRGRGDAGSLRRTLEEAGIRVEQVRTAFPGIEDVFIHHVSSGEAEQAALPVSATQDASVAPAVPGAPTTRTPSPTDAAQAADPNQTAVEVTELTRRFGSFTAVDRVTFQVGRGEIFGYLGANGAGKSTTIKMLTGLLPPTSGEARVAGYDIAGESLALRQHIGYMSQKFSLYPDLTVQENLDLYAGLYRVPRGVRKQRQEWVLEVAGLTGQRDVLTGSLSGGMKQRLALGTAILHQPELIFLDEPTSGVDPVARRQFWHLINALSALGVTVFVTTHYMDEAEYCHRLGFMYAGRLIACDRPDVLKRRVIGEEILSIALDDPAKGMKALAGTPWEGRGTLFGAVLHVQAEDLDAARRELPGLFASRGLEMRGMATVPPSLEDVFVALIGKEGTA